MDIPLVETVLKAEKITKEFPGVIALKNVSFDLNRGEVHALCGENGAGKSTLIKLLSGIHAHGTFTGDLYVDGKPAAFANIKDAEKADISVIYQELALVNEMTVAENIFLGWEPVVHGFIDWDSVYKNAHELLSRFNIDIDPSAKVSTLGVGQQQLVEIVKALSKNTKILILDEPTAALTEQEVEILLNNLRELKKKGLACIYISHKLDEVLSIADRITVLRDGESIVTLNTADTSKNALVKYMVNREISDLFPKRTSEPDKIVLEVERLHVADSINKPNRLENISFTVRSGEVLGFGGLMGAGRTELLMHIFGAWGYRKSGKIKLNDIELLSTSPSDSIKRGMALISEDRKRYGLILEQSIGFNLSLSHIGELTNNMFIDQTLENQINKEYFDSLQIKAPGLDTTVSQLSGGNQQKVVIGKALMTEPDIVFLDEPTRGIDVGAKLEVYEWINKLTGSGKAVVLVSSELPELMGMSDRIIMLHEGKIGGVFERSNFNQEDLLAAAMG